MAPWNAKLRRMENGDICIPFSVAFVLKRFENLNIKKCTFDAKMTLILRLKLNGLDEETSKDQMKEVINICKTKLQLRIHEEEGMLHLPPQRFSKATTTKSKDWKVDE